MTDPERHPSAANRQLERRSRDAQKLVRWIEEIEEQRSRDAQILVRWIERLNAAYSSLLNSRHWKVGSVVVELGRRALFRPTAPTDDPREIEESFRAWREESRARQEEFRTRWEEFIARREYLDPAKGRPGTIEVEEPRTVAADAQPLASPAGHFGAAEHVLRGLRDIEPVTIIVPIRTAPANLKNCLESLVRNTTTPAKLLVFAASDHPGTSSLLAEYEALENVRVLTSGGFAGAVNLGYSESGGDIVVLDATVEVAPRWLENLTLAAYADPRTATVTAISNYAGALSVPVIGEENSAPEDLERDDVGRLITQWSGQIYPQTPTGSSFCMYVKRAALDEAGTFDAETFPQGYAEDDFCMRAQKLGWNHVVDDSTFVFRKRSTGTDIEEKKFSEAARKKLDELHPEYAQLARAFAASEDRKRVGRNVTVAYRNAESSRAKPRILFVIHGARGGTAHTNLDLMGALADRYSPYMLVSNMLQLRLFRYEREGPVLVEKWNLRRRYEVTEFSRPDYRAIVFGLLVKYRFELVHIRHLMGHTFDLPEVAARLRIPMVLSFHDFYFSCPTVQLIDDNGNYCGGICTPGTGRQCTILTPRLEGLPILKHAWLKTWRWQVERMFEHVDAFVTTSLAAKDVYLRSLPSLRDRPFEVIEHGRDLEQEHLAVPPGEGPVRILVPGNIDVHKGADFVRKLKREDPENRLEFHFLGKVTDEFKDLGVDHGTYAREEFNSRVREIEPSFMGIFSIWPETYCHTLTEAWAAGVPVLASDIGTLRERVNAHGGGWLIDFEDPKGSYRGILEIAGDPATYARGLEHADLHGTRTVREMSDDYEALYESVLHERRAFKKSAG